jgi:hypothetical protein
LPTIYQPLQESVGKDRVTLSWQARGNTGAEYKFVITVKEYAVAKNPNIKGIEREINKNYNRATITELMSGTTYAATIRTADLSDSSLGGLSTTVVFTTSKY